MRRWVGVDGLGWVVGTTIDVTERRRVELDARPVEQALVASEERFRIVADGLPFPSGFTTQTGGYDS